MKNGLSDSVVQALTYLRTGKNFSMSAQKISQGLERLRFSYEQLRATLFFQVRWGESEG